MAFRQYRRASSGADAGVQAILYWLAIITAPIWIPIVIVVTIYQQCAGNAEAEKARLRITPAEIRLDDLRLEPQYSGSYKLTGRVYNMSHQFTLTSLDLKLTIQDCLPGGKCDTVGESTESPFLTIPPGQARDLDERVHFSGVVAPRGNLTWRYDLIGIKGR